MSTHADLYAFVLHLRAEAGGPPPDAPGHQAQALFFELVRQIDPELANRLHADAQSKPFTVAALPQGSGVRGQGSGDSSTTTRQSASRSLDPQTLTLRVTLAGAELFAPFTRALFQQVSRPALRLGHSALVLADVYGTPGSQAWAGYTSFAELAAVQPAPVVTLLFATPTAFGQGTRVDGRPRVGLLPTPEAVFGSIARRWNELAPQPLRLDMEAVEAACRETLITRYQAESRTYQLGKGTQKGFVGLCTYETPVEQAQATLITLLADAVFFLGVGMKTGRGMGVCRRLGQHDKE